MCGESRGASFEEKPLEYFAHDSNAASDPKCRRLIRECGVAGYGRFWLLCEALASEPSHSLAVETNNDMENVAVTLDLDSVEEVAEFLRVLVRLGLVVVEDGALSSHRMDRNAERVTAQREQRRAAALARWHGSS